MSIRGPIQGPVFGKNPLALAAVFLAVAVAASFSAINFDLAVAIDHADEGPAAYALLFSNPEMFQGDVWRSYALHYRWSTIVYWLPGLLHQYLGADRILLSLYEVMANQVLLAAAAYYLARKATDETLVPVLCAATILLARPWTYNLALFDMTGGELFEPYSGLIVLPFAIFALGATLSGRYAAATALYFAAGLVHANMAVYAAAIGACYVVMSAGRADRSRGLRTAAWFLAVVLVCFLPMLYLRTGIENALSGARHFAVLSETMHVSPWLHEDFIRDSWPPYFLMLAAVVFAFLKVRGRTPAYDRLFLSSLAVAAGFAGIHLAGLVLENASLVSNVGLRASLYPIVLGFPMVLAVIAGALVRGNPVLAIAAAAALAELCLRNIGALPAVMLLALFERPLDGAWAALRSRFGLRLGSGPAAGLRTVAVRGLAVACAVAWAATAWHDRQGVRTPYAEAARDVQLWARDRTGPEALFFAPVDGWRTLSERRLLYSTFDSQSRYVPDATALELWDRQLRLYNRIAGGMTVDGVFFPSLLAFLEASPQFATHHDLFNRIMHRLSAEQFSLFADEFGVTHVVLERARLRPWPALPVVYENPEFIVFGLGDG